MWWAECACLPWCMFVYVSVSVWERGRGRGRGDTAARAFLRKGLLEAGARAASLYTARNVPCVQRGGGSVRDGECVYVFFACVWMCTVPTSPCTVEVKVCVFMTQRQTAFWFNCWLYLLWLRCDVVCYGMHSFWFFSTFIFLYVVYFSILWHRLFL